MGCYPVSTWINRVTSDGEECCRPAEPVLLRQDAFAADYQEDEYTLLGMAIKYAGLRGKEVRVIGKTRSFLGEEERVQ